MGGCRARHRAGLTPLSLGDRLASLGFRLVHINEVGSTNELSSQLAREGEAEGLIVLADSQAAGRGRQGRSWLSPEGCGLFVSFLRRPDLPARDAWLWTLLAGIALQAAVAPVCEDSWLKWPNDLFRGKEKLGGILCELQVSDAQQIESIVVGVGLNLYCPPLGWPSDLRNPAGSVWTTKKPSGDCGRRDDLLVRLASNLLMLEVDLAGPGREALLVRYRAAMTPMIGHAVHVELPGGTIEATVEGISDKGALLVVDGEGQCRSVLAGDVHLQWQGAILS